MGLNDEPNTIKTQTVSSDEQFSGLGGRRVMGAGELWEQAENSSSQIKAYTVHDEVHNFPEIKSWAIAKWLK